MGERGGTWALEAVLQSLSCLTRTARTALTTLVSSFIMSKVDYCNVVLAGLPQRELDRVQSVVNAAARLSADARKYDHVTPLLMDLAVQPSVTVRSLLPVLRCCRSTSVEQLTIWHSNIYTIIRHVQETSEILSLSTVFLQPVELVTTCTLTMLGAPEVVRAAYCALKLTLHYKWIAPEEQLNFVSKILNFYGFRGYIPNYLPQ